MFFLSWLESVYFFLNKDEDRSYHTHDIIVVSMIFLETLLMFPFAIIHIFYGFYLLSIIQFILGFVFLVVLFIPNKKLAVSYKEDIAIANLIFLFWAMLALGGIEDTGIYWSPMLPFIVFTMSGISKGFKWILFYCLGVAGLQTLNYFEVFQSPYSFEQVFYFLTAFSVYTIIALIFEQVLSSYRVDLEKYNSQLEQSRGELNHVLGNLEKEVESQTFELQDSNRRLREEINEHKETSKVLAVMEQEFFQAQKMEALGSLVRCIAYNFSTILSGIKSNLFFIQRKIKGNTLVQDKLDEVDKSVFHASEMTKQLLTFARKDTIEKTSFDISLLINETVKLTSLSLPSSIKFKYNLSSSPMFTVGNFPQLQQVMVNLINNSGDALTGCENPSISVNAFPLSEATGMREEHPSLQGEWVYLSVVDNGLGIKAEDLSHVFDPFFSSKGSGDGTGLGLAMCYGAVQSHGGTISVDSKVNQQTTFHVYLPMLEADGHEYNPSGIDKNLLGKGETILIVDDDESLGTAHKLVLEKLNYNVIWIQDAVEAIRLYVEKGDGIDLVVMDILMPNMNGMQAAHHILMIDPDAKIFFSSGYEFGEGKSIEDESLAYIRRLNKPFTVEQLCKQIRVELDQS